MKIKPEHVETIKGFVSPLDTSERRQRYINGDFPNSASTKDLDKRYRWDLFYANPASAPFACDVLYKYSHDEHIDTALRSIVKPLRAA